MWFCIVEPLSFKVTDKDLLAETAHYGPCSNFLSSRKRANIVLTPLTPLLYGKTGVYSSIH